MAKHISNTALFIVSIKSMLIGLRLTLKHFFIAIGLKRKSQVSVMDKTYFMQKDGIVTNLYPHESIPVPDNGRYRLHNEIEDCIVCDLCAKVCPVNCIDIEPIKSPVEITKTSDGSPKRIYAAVFDIDMAKCCYCGLCTTVCPTESLTMTKTYDFSEYDVSNMIYHFAELSPAQGVLKREEMDVLAAEEKAKKAAAAASKIVNTTEGGEKSVAAKPAFKPKVAMPGIKKPSTEEITDNLADTTSTSTATEFNEESVEKTTVPKPVFKPKVMIPTVKKTESEETEKAVEKSNDEVKPITSDEVVASKPQAKPVMKPVMKPIIPKVPPTESTGTDIADSIVEKATTEDNTSSETEERPVAKPKPIMKPVMKPVMKPIIPKAPTTESTGTDISDSIEEKATTEDNTSLEAEVKPADKPKPVMKPIMKPVMKPIIPKTPSAEIIGEDIPIKNALAEEQTTTPEAEVKPAAKPKPIMKPIMKPIIPKKTDEGGEPSV
ncbi:4Fe-4S dicluster domain-containing protein [uncultured Cytophaga sp.]|uniref:4Fe-4S dicluster domain-containing protein n=1 Tax=uncultured Cytophaga sp. TaxID=160238 RepID=UPI002601FAD0|nr:4Fe-4S dicluster domain-containing protein [uncultured Cytophaga sp.]